MVFITCRWFFEKDSLDVLRSNWEMEGVLNAWGWESERIINEKCLQKQLVTVNCGVIIWFETFRLFLWSHLKSHIHKNIPQSTYGKTVM